MWRKDENAKVPLRAPRFVVYLCFSALAGLVTAIPIAIGGDWPAYLHDNSRSAATSEQLQLPLQRQWAWTMLRGPRPAWDENPSLQDFWNNCYGNKTRMPDEDAFHVVVAGNLLYFGSSNSDSVACLNAYNGMEKWKYFTGGPVRFAPAVDNSRVYFGSDDGYVYCLNAADGSFVWSQRATSSDELMFINGRMVSVCPVRTAVLVDNGVAYWGTGLFSGAQTDLSRYLCAFNATTGVQVWKITPGKPTQGYLLASTNYLYVPAGKSTPCMYNRPNGNYIGVFGTDSGRGGCYALLTSDSKFFYGPHYSATGSWVGDYNANTRVYESVAEFYGNHLVVTSSYSYCSTDTTLFKVNRSNQQTVWSVSSPYRSALILAGDTLFAGGDDEIAALSTANGSVLWTAPVNGRVHSLAAANGRLYVSTDLGIIYCFGKFAGDLDGDDDVDLKDLAMFAAWWLDSSCGVCGGADFTGDGNVRLDDLKVLVGNWLKGF
jgi:outer membrane protein assembly factor BamB